MLVEMLKFRRSGFLEIGDISKQKDELASRHRFDSCSSQRRRATGHHHKEFLGRSGLLTGRFSV